MKKYIIGAILSIGIFVSPAFAPQAEAAALTTLQATSLIAIVQSSPSTPASNFVNLITAFSGITVEQAISLIVVVQSSPSTPASSFVNVITSFTDDTIVNSSTASSSSINSEQSNTLSLATSTTPAETGFNHYGYIYFDYSSGNNDLADLATYTSTITATSIEQAQLAIAKGFHDIFYTSQGLPLNQLLTNEGITTQDESSYDYRTISNYETKILALYRQQLIAFKSSLQNLGLYDKIETFYIADEPALHRNIVPNQEFLNNVDVTFKGVFPDKHSMMGFAEETASTNPFVGAHYSPPPTLDYVLVDPYFWNNTNVDCSESNIKSYLYSTNRNSTIGWALQWGKPVIVAGDAMLRNGESPLPCYITNTYSLLRKDNRINGILWFTYENASGNQELIKLIKNLTAPASLVIAPTATSLSIRPSSVGQNDSFTMSWSGNNSPTYYEYNVNGGTLFQKITDTSWSGTAASLRLSAGTTYTIGVHSCNTAGCSPLATGNLTVTAAATTCTSWSYGAFGSCQSNNTQTRAVTASYPAGCTGGSPIVTQGCTYVSVPTSTSLTIPSSVGLNDSFTMSWSGNNSPTYYEYNVNGGTLFQKITDTSWSGTAASLGLSAGMTYSLGVRSCNLAGCSPLTTGSLMVTTSSNQTASAYDAFNSATNSGSSESPSTGNTSTFHYVWNNNLQIGSSYTADVSALQTALTREGVYTGEVSGGFYNQTFTAVKAFQQKYGIDTGITGAGFVGLKTRAKLNTLY